MGAPWLVGLVLFVIGGTSLACRLMAVSRRPAPPPPLRLIEGGHVRVWPAWWSQLDQWRDELGDGGTFRRPAGGDGTASVVSGGWADGGDYTPATPSAAPDGAA